MKIRLQRTTRYDFPRLIDALHIRRGVEIGVSKGAYSHYLLKESSLELLWSIDPYVSRGRKAERVDASTSLAEFGNRSRLIRSSSVDAANLAEELNEKFGFIYIDGNHSAKCVKRDIEVWFSLLARPGILAGHDYVPDRQFIEVIPEVDAFAERLQSPLYLTSEHWASWFFVLGE
jgi:predicted O-methyltransferase YrrM